jgi:hypothetical protein
VAPDFFVPVLVPALTTPRQIARHAALILITVAGRPIAV